MLSPESCFDIIARESVERGQSTAAKEKLRVVEAEGERPVLLKWTSYAEVVALRAANRVPGTTAIPRLIRCGRDSRGDWIAIPYYSGNPTPTETDVPDNVIDSIAAVHAHYLNSGPPDGMPVRDANWWQAACTMARLRQLDRPVLRPIVEAVRSWATHPLIIDALTHLPRTLLHGDVHRNNMIVDGTTGQLIDWGGAAYGIPMLDLITPGPPGSRGYARYAATWRELTGESTTSAAWRRGYLVATVCTKVSYLPFVARNFGDAAAIGQFDAAVGALTELERC